MAGTDKGAASVGAGAAAPAQGSNLRQRKTVGGADASKGSAQVSVPQSAGTGASGMLRFYTEDAPGLIIGPVPVLVMSLVFILCVLLLHIWGKLRRDA